MLVSAIFFWFDSSLKGRFGLEQTRQELFLDLEPEEIFIFVSGQGSLSADDEFALVKRVQDALVDVPGILSVSTTSGSNQGAIQVFDASGPTDPVGALLVSLQTKIHGYDGRLAERKMREALAAIPGARYEISQREQGPPSGKDLQIALRSENNPALVETALKIRDYLRADTDLREVDDSLPLPGIEYQLQVDRAQAGKFGIDVAQIGSVVQLITNGVLVGKYRPDDALDEVDIRVRLPENFRSVEALSLIHI